MPAGPVARPWRKLLRLSVRGLIVVVLVMGAGLGWIARSARIQRDAVVAIYSAGGSCYYDWELTDGAYGPGWHHWTPIWLAAHVGVDYFADVAGVVVGDSSDATIEQVARLSRLERLVLNSSSIGDAGLVRLKRLSNLSSLDLGFTPVTDAGLTHLKALSNLSRLNLNGTRVTDTGLTELEDLRKLSYLTLGGKGITDAGLVNLKRLTNLSELTLFRTQVTDAGIGELQRALPGLTIDRE